MQIIIQVKKTFSSSQTHFNHAPADLFASLPVFTQASQEQAPNFSSTFYAISILAISRYTTPPTHGAAAWRMTTGKKPFQFGAQPCHFRAISGGFPPKRRAPPCCLPSQSFCESAT